MSPVTDRKGDGSALQHVAKAAHVWPVPYEHEREDAEKQVDDSKC